MYVRYPLLQLQLFLLTKYHKEYDITKYVCSLYCICNEGTSDLSDMYVQSLRAYNQANYKLDPSLFFTHMILSSALKSNPQCSIYAHNYSNHATVHVLIHF